ncbi:hypothetical protein HW115_11935 [Verrucomicrobiaceae bacterium N1E253]|uniref:Uncharacterized protein n=1 Tax=Oceaniferula marina TaxID=2748318 RepID=A0A851GQ92_9BACT|nr:hypothetical protein [Oceaniferula marina]NWK56324.1 hypothetical protein [Oceaniferula marina]
MNTIQKVTLLFGSLAIALPGFAQASNKSVLHNKRHNVRIMRNDDGSFTEFRKSSDERVIERRNYHDRQGGNGDRVLRMSIIYRKDVHGKLRSGRIHDGTGKILYRVVYGYHKTTGQLVAENMYDARVKRTEVVTDPQSGEAKEVEVPVRKLYHRYDAQGRRAKPIVFCLPAGKRAEELFGPDGSSHIEDPWKKTANPNARPTR